jgi:hypothetical protein
MDRDSFLKRKPATSDVTLDDGAVVKVRKLTEGEVQLLKKKYSTEATALEGLRFIVARCLVNEDGQRVLEDGDVSKLTEMDFDTIQSIANEVMKFSGLMKDKKSPNP